MTIIVDVPYINRLAQAKSPEEVTTCLQSASQHPYNDCCALLSLLSRRQYRAAREVTAQKGPQIRELVRTQGQQLRLYLPPEVRQDTKALKVIKGCNLWPWPVN